MKSALYEYDCPNNHTIKLYDLEGSTTLSLVLPDIAKNTYGVLDLAAPQTHMVDLGAHVGTFAIWLSKQFPEATIYAIEPLVVNFMHLEQNLIMNNCTNVIPLNIAITGDGRDIRLACYPQNTGGALPILANDNCPIIKSATLDQFIDAIIPKDEQISFLKSDVEGAEYEIFKEFKQWNKIHDLGVEVHKYPDLDEDKDWRPPVLSFIEFLKSRPITGKLWTPPLELYEM